MLRHGDAAPRATRGRLRRDARALRGTREIAPRTRSVRVARVMSDARSAHKPVYTRFSQQQLSGARPALSPVHTAKIALALAIPFLGVGGAIWNGVKGLDSIVERYDDAVACRSGFFSSASELASKISETGAGTTCAVSVVAKKTLTAPVYVYYELGNYFQNHRAYVRDSDYFELAGGEGANQGLCRTHEKTSTGAAIVPCGVQAWSYFNDTFSVKLDGVNAAINDDNIAWDADRKYRFGNFPAQNLNTDQATRGGASVSGNIRDDQHFVTWMRTAAFSKFRKLVGKIESDIPKGTNVTFVIGNRYNTYVFDGSKSIVLATNSWIGGYNPVLPALYLLVGSLMLILGVLSLVLLCFFNGTDTRKFAGLGVEAM